MKSSLRKILSSKWLAIVGIVLAVACVAGGVALQVTRNAAADRKDHDDLRTDSTLESDDASKPLRSKLLAAPALRARYLAYVRQIAAKWLDSKTVGPLAEKYQALIAAEVKADTRKLASYEAFEQGLTQLKNFMDQRKAYLAAYK